MVKIFELKVFFVERFEKIFEKITRGTILI